MESDGPTDESDGRPTPQKDSQKVVDAGGRTIVSEGERVTGVVGVGVRAGTPGGDEGDTEAKLIETHKKRKDAIFSEKQKRVPFSSEIDGFSRKSEGFQKKTRSVSFILFLYSLILSIVESIYIIEFKTVPASAVGYRVSGVF